jgi:uncharacterized protein YkwD
VRLTRARVWAVAGAALAALGLPVAAPASASSASRAARAAAPATSEAALGRAVVREVNRQRRTRGLRRLKVSAQLAEIAERHSDDQLGGGRLSHTLAGVTAAQRIRAASPAIETGEVIGFLGGGPRRGAARRLVAMWLKSPRHRSIILGRRFSRIGVGSAVGVLGGASGLLVTADLAGR